MPILPPSFDLRVGLFYLRVKNVLHRDLKVANLLLNREGMLRIADFGTTPRPAWMGWA